MDFLGGRRFADPPPAGTGNKQPRDNHKARRLVATHASQRSGSNTNTPRDTARNTEGSMVQKIARLKPVLVPGSANVNLKNQKHAL